MPEDLRTLTRTDQDWSRDDWLNLADRLLAAARRHGSPGHARIVPPGAEGGYGRDVDGLEGFARTFLTAGFRIAGARGAGLDELIDWYATGLAAGVDQASPERWVRLTEHGQAKVEAASIALILDMTRPWLWDRLGERVQEQVVDYLAPAVGDDTYPQINWVWFRLVVQTFLRSVGGPWSAGEVEADLATHDSFRRAGGWLSDGPRRAYDHYTGWALHLYPTLWARMAGAEDVAAPRRQRYTDDLDRYLQDALALVGGDGSPLLQGRSLIYRFAAAAPFWAGAIAGVPSAPPGQLRHAATRIVQHFAERGAPDADGLLSLGWHGPWRRLAQSYSGPGSPYWASKGLLGIALPADHPVWTAPGEPLPIERGDVSRAVTAPGWLISGTRADGIVRVVNHGTDHAYEGQPGADSPLYARLGYSTATAPVLDESGWIAPVDQSVTLIDRAGNTTHRAGMRTLVVQEGLAGSRGPVHWIRADDSGPDHGSGRSGTAERAATLTVFSLVRGPFELRLARVDDVAGDPDTLRLRVGGWPVAGRGDAAVIGATVTATGNGLTSYSAALPPLGSEPGSGREPGRRSDREAGSESGFGSGSETGRETGREAGSEPGFGAASEAGFTVHDDAGPLGGPVRVPWADHPVRAGVWTATLLALTAAPVVGPHCRAALGPGENVTVTWPDGVTTRHHLDLKEKG
ncbi:DUF2264 domain-containing protein [Actinoplanes awajinensis]|uniref:DUF2264 domain-containing protein n=1 Tax=Actinoplanes awajinensis subsp. mycoplanecinus TaxID=135947 RepID=A0A101JJE3_9ACTN|nr:DUF2264 domain-containing protein [Actinoplanes awajinensis]KUL27887.1 hypothetical protein ADL15_34220 [Actinoplanes awajinensis subsp. mycoplanecinus]